MAIYTSFEKYIEAETDLMARIQRIDNIIIALENSMINAGTVQPGKDTAALNEHTEEYSLDDGQTKIRTKYRNANEFIEATAAAINKFDFIKQKLIARLNNNRTGRVIRLVDSKNLNTGCA
jgi:hypothetical protein